MTPPLSQGDGPLYADPSAHHAREFFRNKPRALVDKLMSVKDAVAKFVNDGEYLAVGGFGGVRLGTALCHEIVRQQKQNLTICGHTATHDFQILAAGNLTGHGQLIARVDVAYIVGLEARGLSPHARRVMESGEIECTEWSNYALAVRFKAAAMGLPFLPMRSMLGTDTFKKSAAKEIVCPFTGDKLLAVPACYPDVGVIHVHEADRYGNCRLRGTSVADIDLARASKKLIVSCERLIPNDVIRQDPTLTVIPFYCVDAVCEVPFGSYPGNMPYEYFSDEEHLRQWLEVEADEAEYKKFIDKYIYGVRDFNEYLQLCGGLPRLQKLRQEEFLLNRGR
jgi:glutaconate CoA-transferase subunit A